MALHSVYCADVPLRNCSLTHSLFDQLLHLVTVLVTTCDVIVLIN